MPFCIFILNYRNIFLAQCLYDKLLYWRVAVNTFTFVCVWLYDMTLILLKWNGKMLVMWLSEQFWRSSLCIYVLIETADDEITAGVRRSSVYVEKTAFIRSFTQILAEHAGFIFESTFAA